MNSFSRPGGNFTGATYMSYEVNAKRVELLREAFPHVRRVAILSNPLHPGEQGELKNPSRAPNGSRSGFRMLKCGRLPKSSQRSSAYVPRAPKMIALRMGSSCSIGSGSLNLQYFSAFRLFLDGPNSPNRAAP